MEEQSPSSTLERKKNQDMIVIPRGADAVEVEAGGGCMIVGRLKFHSYLKLT